MRKLNWDSVIYAHCYISVLPAVLLKNAGLSKEKLFYEKMAFLKNNRTHEFITRNMDSVIAINDYIRTHTGKAYNLHLIKPFQRSA